MDLIGFFFAMGPLLWIAMAIWWLIHRVTGSKPSIMALPFAIHQWLVGSAGLSNFASCPNGQEYCDELYRLERLGGRMLFQLCTAFWVGVVVWFWAIFRRTNTTGEGSVG